MKGLIQRISPRVLVLVALPLLLAAITTAVLVGPLGQSRLGATDDHEYITFLGPDMQLPLTEVPDVIAGTEVGSPGATLRYRPFFYSAKVLETSLWPGNAQAYYSLHILFFAALAAALFFVSIRTLGIVAGVLIAALTFDLPFWGDVWARLGAAEQYASPGLALFLVGAARMVGDLWARTPRRWDLNAWLLALGLLLAAASKENFVYLAAPAAMLGFMGWRSGRIGWPGLAAITFSVVCAAAILLAVYLGISRSGQDIYGGAADGGRLAAFGRFFAQMLDPSISPYPPSAIAYLQKVLNFALIAAAAAVPIFLAIWRLLPAAERGPYGRTLAYVGAVNVFAFAWLAWEILFYKGELPSGVRYDFPALLIAPVVLGSIVFALGAIPVRRPVRWGLVAAALVGLIVLRANAEQNLFQMRDVVAANVERTARFEGDLRELARVVRQHPDWPIYVEVIQAMDYEFAVTLGTWLDWQRVENPVFMRMHEPDPPVSNAFHQTLLDTMSGVSSNGELGYTPIAELDPGAEAERACYSLSYSGPLDEDCTPLLLRPR